MALLYKDMTEPQKRIFNLIVEDGEKVRAAKHGIGLDVLVEEENIAVRVNVAMNPETPQDVLAKLVSDTHPYVRSAALKNPSTPEEVLIREACSGKTTKLGDIADNPAIDDEIAKLIMDSDNPVGLMRLAVNEHISKTVAETLFAQHQRTHGQLAKNNSIPYDLADKLAASPSKDARINIAVRPDLSAETKSALAADKSLEVRLSLAKNPDLPLSVQEILSNDTAANVRAALSCNKAANHAILEKMTFKALALDTDLISNSVGMQA